MKAALALLAVAALAAATPLERHADQLELELQAFIREEVAAAMRLTRYPNSNPLLPARDDVDVQRIGKFLCKPCKALFAVVREELATLPVLNREVLRPAVHKICKEKAGQIEQLEHLCENLADAALNKLADWLKEEGSKIEPERACTVLHFC